MVELTKKLGAKPGADVLVSDGLWIAWPKKASLLETDLDFDTVQRIGLDAGLVDTRAQRWTGEGRRCDSSTASPTGLGSIAWA